MIKNKLNSKLQNKIRSILLTLINSELQKIKRQVTSAKINSRSLQQFELEQYGNIFVQLQHETFISNTSENIREVKVLSRTKKVSPSSKFILQQIGKDDPLIDINKKKTTLSFQKMQRFNETVLKKSALDEPEVDDSFRLNIVPVESKRRTKKTFTFDKNKYQNSNLGFKFLRGVYKKMKFPTRNPAKKYSRSFDKKETKRFKEEKNHEEQLDNMMRKNKNRTNSIPCTLLSTLDLENLEKLIIKSRRNTVKESPKFKLFSTDSTIRNERNLTVNNPIQESPLIHPSDTSDLSRVSSDVFHEGYSSSKPSTHEDFKIIVLKCNNKSTSNESSNGHLLSEAMTQSNQNCPTNSSKSTQELFFQTSKSSFEYK